MEKETAKKLKQDTPKKVFQDAYIEYLLTEGKVPNSIFLFTKHLKLSEGSFYKHFNSFKSLERSIWSNWFTETVQTIEQDEAYIEYSVREKLLAFYYTWIELLKSNRSFVMFKLDKMDKKNLNPSFLSEAKKHFEEYVNNLLLEGKDTTEVAERPFSNQYAKLFWMHFLFISKFWSNDESSEFEKTDVAIEKSINLAFDLIRLQLEIDGDIFDPPPATVRGNIINVDDTDELVVGYFLTTDITVDTLSIPKEALPFIAQLPVFPDDCQVLPNTTTIKPDIYNF